MDPPRVKKIIGYSGEDYINYYGVVDIDGLEEHKYERVFVRLGEQYNIDTKFSFVYNIDREMDNIKKLQNIPDDGRKDILKGVIDFAEKKAAIKIQAAVRGRSTRKKLQSES